LLTLVTLWWLLFWTALGLCIGSFLNVVIYRIPNDKSLRIPLWSACPHCRNRIRWHDNIPVLSFILLRGRCRDCGVPIATRYPVIEMAMVIVVLMLLDAFFIGESRAGLRPQNRLGMTEGLSYDWPILVAHIVLFACLMAMSAIDLEHYWVDIRFTNLATWGGFVFHTLWTPIHSTQWVRPSDTTAVVSVFGLVGLGVVWLVFICRPHADPEDYGERDVPLGDFTQLESITPSQAPPSLQSPSRTAAWVCFAVLAGLWLALFVDETGAGTLRHAGRGLLPLLLFFVLILAESMIPRESDHAIVEAIHDERHEARRMVLMEFAMLSPAIVMGLVGLAIMQGDGEWAGRISGALHGEIRLSDRGLFRNWAPLFGFATAASGYMISGAIGWAVRIVFTLLFGKEAFGAGDVHMMAAAGAVVGWPVVLIGFFLTCGVALLGWVISLPFKRTRAVPLGPWLSLGFLAVTIFYSGIIRQPIIARAVDVVEWILRGDVPAKRPGVRP